MVSGIEDLDQIKMFHTEGFGFESSSVEAICIAVSNSGTPVIGCSWKFNEIYWYEVSQTLSEELEDVVNNGGSVGSFIASSIKPYANGVFEAIDMTKITVTSKSIQGTSSSTRLSLTNAFLAFFQAQQLTLQTA